MQACTEAYTDASTAHAPRHIPMHHIHMCMHMHMHMHMCICWGRVDAQSSVGTVGADQRHSAHSLLPAACNDQIAASKARRLPSLLFNSALAAAPTAAVVTDRGPASFATLLDIKANRFSDHQHHSNGSNGDTNTAASASAPAAATTLKTRLWVAGMAGALGRYEYGTTRALSGSSPWSTSRSLWTTRALSAVPAVTLKELLVFARELRVDEQVAGGCSLI